MKKIVWSGFILALMTVMVMSFSKSPPDSQIDTVSITIVADYPGSRPEFEPTFITRYAIDRIEQVLTAGPPATIMVVAMVAKPYSVQLGVATISRTPMTIGSEVMPASGPIAEAHDPRLHFGERRT